MSPVERTERTWVDAGMRYRVVAEPRARYPPRLLRRTRSPAEPLDPDAILARLDPDRARMAERVLREGARGWRRWSTLRRHAGTDLSPIVAETELLDPLCRSAGLVVEDVRRNGSWTPSRFRADDDVRAWLGIVTPEELRRELSVELADTELLAALDHGPPPGMSWGSFAFTLRAAQRLTDLAAHGVRPGARELAGTIDHTKAWTPRRRALVEELLGRSFTDLLAPIDRQLAIRGPVRHAEGGLWASALDGVDLTVEPSCHTMVLVENAETFRHLLPLADEGWIVLLVPGGPPPAECELISRLAALAPGLEIHTAFDLDPAGLRIASVVSTRTGLQLQPTGMTPQLLEGAEASLPLTNWDRAELERSKGRCGRFEELRAAIERLGRKVEQETIQRDLISQLRGATARS